MEPPQKSRRLSVIRRNEGLRLEGGKEKPIDRTAWPGSVGSPRHGRFYDGTKSPLLPGRFVIDGHLHPAAHGRVAGIRRTHRDPLFEDGNFLAAHSRLRRHLEIGIAVANRVNEETFIRITRNDGRACIAALLPRAAPIEPEPPLAFVRLLRVALVAMLHEERPHRVLEKGQFFRSEEHGRGQTGENSAGGDGG